MIRKASLIDASRIAEILIFAKRVNYRSIFNDDLTSFNKMQVYPLAKDYLEYPEKLNNIFVYDDEFVKGMIHIEGKQIVELYVDPFFVNNGIGTKLITFAIEKYHCNYLWVLEKNTKAISFYQKHGFMLTNNRKLEEGTIEYIQEMKR